MTFPDILLEDEFIVAFDKPSGLPVAPGVPVLERLVVAAGPAEPLDFITPSSVNGERGRVSTSSGFLSVSRTRAPAHAACSSRRSMRAADTLQ